MPDLRLMAVLAHPDDESLGCGGTLAKYASEGVAVHLLTATRGERGRFKGQRFGTDGHPGPERMAVLREQELRDAGAALGVREVALLGYRDQEVDRADPAEAAARIAAHIRRVRPHVVLTFGAEGAYGHPDHIAISQFTSAGIVAAADPGFVLPDGTDPPHRVDKLYQLAWAQEGWAMYQDAFGPVATTVDDRRREAVPWPDWAVTTRLDTRAWWQDVWRAISCHTTQIAGYERLFRLTPAQHEALWGYQAFYRVFSFVNGGRGVESDLFEGLRPPSA